MAASNDCQHLDFAVYAAINRLTDSDELLTGFSADVKVNCKVCGLPFVFLGLPMGLNLDGACVSVDGQELRVAIAPSFEWVGPGKVSAVRGFSATFTRGEAKGGDQ